MGGEVMKIAMKRLIIDEKGAALILALILLLIGGLISAALLGHMGAGILAGQVHERRTAELYAADAGVEDAIWKIQNSDGYLPCSPGSPPRNYTITDADGRVAEVNDKRVEVTIDYADSRAYRVTATSITEGGTHTTIQAYVYGFSFPDNAITAKKDVDLGNNVYVDGWIQYGENLNPKPNAEFDPDKTINEVYTNWPSSGELYDYYYSTYINGKTFDEYYSEDCVIDADSTPSVGSIYCDGYLDFMSSDNSVKKELALGGTIYVNGNLYVGDYPEAKDFTLNLDGQTIFCEGDIYVTGKTDIIGSGSIIAKGNIHFEPNFTGSDDYILLLALEGNLEFWPTGDFTGFVISVDGQVDFKPGGIFKGSVAGDVIVDLESNVTVIYQSAVEANINFPFDTFANWRIRSWNII